MDEIGENVVLSTKTPLFVDGNAKNALLSTKPPHFVDESEKKADNYSKKDSADGRSLRRGKPLAGILPECRITEDYHSRILRKSYFSGSAT